MAHHPSPEPEPEPDWGARWPDPLDEEAFDDRDQRRDRPRITHLVLVDGLPADHWVEEGADGRWESRTGRLGAPWRSGPVRPPHEVELDWLDSLVGGREALLVLDAAAPPDRPLDLTPLPDLVRPRARDVAARAERRAVEIFEQPEMATVVRRVVEAVLSADPGTMVRSERDDTLTGAVVWIAGHANGLIGIEGLVLTRDLWARLGIASSAGSRGASLLRRLPFNRDPGRIDAQAPRGAPRLKPTGLPGALLTSTRELLVVRRDAALRARERQHR